MGWNLSRSKLKCLRDVHDSCRLLLLSYECCFTLVYMKHAISMHPACPCCQAIETRRSPRRTLEYGPLSWVFGRPYRCRVCYARFWSRAA